jgi:hypothetical protein
VFGYTTDATTTQQAIRFTQLIERKLATFPTDRAEKLKLLVHTKLVELQNVMISSNTAESLQKNALYESVRRQLFTDSFDTSEAIFDDGVGAIWTHAPKGFGILYNPISTPTIGSLASGTKNTLVNGSYFSRQEDTKYHSGLLWIGGVLWSDMIYDDSHITHIVCLDTKQQISFWLNSVYFDGLLNTCELAFQGGPMIYSSREGIIEQHLESRTYMGSPHNRTIMVLFEKNGIQNLWFLTLIKPETLAEVRDTVLRESRFRGEYDTLTVFNLDGGSSVAHRNPDHPELNFGSRKALPVVFEIYK